MDVENNMEYDDDVEYIKNDYEFTIKYKNKSFFSKIKQKYQSPKTEELTLDEQLHAHHEQLITQITQLTPEKEKQSILLTQKCMILAVLIGFRKGTASFIDVIDAIEQMPQYNNFSDIPKYINKAIDLYEAPHLEKEQFKLLFMLQNQLNDFLGKGRYMKQRTLLEIAKQVLVGTATREDLEQTMKGNSCEKKTLNLLNQVLELDLHQLEDQPVLINSTKLNHM